MKIALIAAGIIIFYLGGLAFTAGKDAQRDLVWNCVVSSASKAHYAGDFEQAWALFAPGCTK